MKEPSEKAKEWALKHVGWDGTLRLHDVRVQEVTELAFDAGAVAQRERVLAEIAILQRDRNFNNRAAFPDESKGAYIVLTELRRRIEEMKP